MKSIRNIGKSLGNVNKTLKALTLNAMIKMRKIH